VKHRPSDVVKLRAKSLDVIILENLTKEKQRGITRIEANSWPSPWVGAAEKYRLAGGKVKGQVVGIVDYGVFVEAGTRHRRLGTRFRNELEQEDPAPVESRQSWR